ncbi:MAG: hypothetical protein H0T59_09595 [Chloroflexi bacterium]|nr:hypothetical protein [Chloroflexota bacterium]
MSTHQLSIESRRPAILSVAVLFVLATVMLLASVAGVGTQSGNRPASVLDPADGKLTDYAFRLQSVGGATIGSDPEDGKLTDYAFRRHDTGR